MSHLETNRRTGRTTRALDAAIKAAGEGQHVLFMSWMKRQSVEHMRMAEARLASGKATFKALRTALELHIGEGSIRFLCGRIPRGVDGPVIADHFAVEMRRETYARVYDNALKAGMKKANALEGEARAEAIDRARRNAAAAAQDAVEWLP